MSYILEALRKADQERAAGAVPDLEATHQVPRPVQRSFRWVWILVVLLAVNGVLMALLATRDTGPAVTAVVDRPIAGTAPGAAGPASPAVKPVLPTDRVVAAVPVPKPVLHQERPAAPARTVAPPVTTAPAPARPSAPSAAVKPPRPAPAVVAKAAPPAPAEPAQQDLRDWEDLSLEFRSGLDMPRLDVHVYDTDPQRRFVLIELRKYRAGDRLDSGAVIEEILPDGLQLSYQGTRFRYRK